VVTYITCSNDKGHPDHMIVLVGFQEGEGSKVEWGLQGSIVDLVFSKMKIRYKMGG